MSEQEPTQLEDLVHYLVEPLVTTPEAITITELPEPKDGATVVQIEVDEKDVGRVIGRQGRVIRSLRGLMTLASRSMERPVTLDLID